MIYEVLGCVYTLWIRRMERIVSIMLWVTVIQSTGWILFKVLLQSTARQGTAYVEVLLFCRTLFQWSEIGLTVTFSVGLSPLNRLLNPFRF